MTPLSRLLAAALAAAPVLTPVGGGLQAAAQTAEGAGNGAADPDGPRPVGVVLNGKPVAEPGLVIRRDGRLLARRSDVESWGLVIRLDTTATVDGEGYIALDGVKGLNGRLDAEGANLLIDADASLFPRFTYDPGQSAVALAEAIPAQFLDYDMTLSSWNGHARLTGLVDAGMSGGWGVARSAFLVQSDGAKVVRLDTAYRRDFPHTRTRLVVGDTIGTGAPWSRPVRYGGLFLGTDFSLDPQSINFPLPVISGSALTASTVELMAQSSRQSVDVGPGAFDLTLQPRLTGAGQVTMSVRDVAGNLRQVTRSFYASPSLLRPGLSEFAVEAGALRKDFGYRSFAYGPAFVAVGLRRGLTSRLTLEGRVEASSRTRMAGLGAAMTVGALAEVSLSGAVSQGRAGTGALLRAQVQRATPVYTLTASYERADAAFRQVGEPLRNGGGRSELAVAGGLALGRYGSINASYARLGQGLGLGRGGENRVRYQLASAYYTANVRGAYLSAGLQYADYRGDRRSVGLFGSLTVSLGPRQQVSAIAEPGRAAVTFNQNLPDQSGFGLRGILGRERGAAWIEGGAAWRGPVGDLRIDAARRRGQDGVQLNARGGLLRVDGTLIASQRIDDGFALVDVESDAPVTVTVENRPRPAKATRRRAVLVTGLQPYAENRIGVRAEDLPIEEDLASAQQIVAPGWRQAVRVRFGSAGIGGVLISLRDTEGAPLPIGSRVDWAGGSGVVGHDGEAWIDHMASNDNQGIGGFAVRVSGAGGVCSAQVPQLSADRKLAATPVTCVSARERT